MVGHLVFVEVFAVICQMDDSAVKLLEYESWMALLHTKATSHTVKL